jgi:hypothetical protein
MTRSTYEKLVDRYVDIASWPSSKKTVLIMGLAVPFHFVGWLMARLHGKGLSGVVDVPRVDTHLAGLLAAVVVPGGLPFPRRCRH